jgi:hypothetical protein
MSEVAIAVESLSKRYLVGHRSSQREKCTALRDVIGREVRHFARGDEIEEFWALK